MPEENYSTHSYDDPIPTASLPYIDASPQVADTPLPTLPAAPAPVLTEIEQIAAAYHLGKIQKEYQNDAAKDLSAGLSACMIGILCCIPLIVVASHGGIVFFGTLGCAAFGLSSFGYGINRTTIGINKYLTNLRFQNHHYYLCSQGILALKGKQIQAVRWDQVQAIQKIYPAKASNIPQKYILYPLGTTTEPIVLEGICVRFKLFRVQLEQQITRRLLPEALTTYKAGQPLTFGPLTVTSEGLSLNAGAKLLPWTNVGSTYEYGGYLIVREKGSRSRWAITEASEILNIGVLLSLIEHMRNETLRKASQQQQPLSYSYLPPEKVSEWQEYE